MEKLNIKNNDKILIIAPHPDDESIWCGGLLLKYPKQCDVLILTDWRYWWESDNYDEIIQIRKKESLKAMKYLQIDNVYFMEIEDSHLKKNFKKFLNYEFSKYTKIFCPNNKDLHIDHACVLNFLKKTGFAKDIYLYEVWSTLDKPSHYIDISKYYLQKMQLIKIYESQVSQLDYSKKILWLNNYRWMQVYPAIDYAEVYKKILH